MKLTVSKNKRTLLRNGQHFFYLADTCWSAFSSIREEEWLYYLEKRKTQGFNTLQINILPQWDRSVSDFDQLPFQLTDGRFDFSNIDEDYFKRAQRLCQIATDQGFSLALVVLWSNYVKGTWASQLDEEKNVFPDHLLENYFAKVIQYFDDFSPLYFIGGDTDFPKTETVETYLKGFDYFEKHSPETLKTIHIKGRFSEIPSEIIQHLDIYLYQSGHNSSFPDMPYSLAEKFYADNPQLPIINSEPCYEQMGYARKVYGRFSQRDVRKAAWQSILSGACAGITYGAHGIWSWQGMASKFHGDLGEAFDSPLLWQDALQLPGANDYGYLKQLLQLIQIENLIPKNEFLIDANEQIRMAATAEEEYFLIYLPSNTKLKLALDLSNYDVSLIDLKTKNIFKPSFQISQGQTLIPTHSCEEDVLIVGKKEGK
ncbi:apiosidase-like domain-containing protein [Enterococcus sp. LJL90]